MINIYVVCKNEIFYKAIQPLLNANDICITSFFKMPSLTSKEIFLETMTNDFLVCTPKPDIVLMDANWNAYEFTGIEIIKTFANIENLKIIVSTTFIDKKIAANFRAIGATSYLIKSLTFEHVLNTIQTTFKADCSQFV